MLLGCTWSFSNQQGAQGTGEKVGLLCKIIMYNQFNNFIINDHSKRILFFVQEQSEEYQNIADERGAVLKGTEDQDGQCKTRQDNRNLFFF